jgi:hypothetical protein
MTDPLTDAVRRLKELQQDVERLQSSQDEAAQPRLFFTTQEQATADDSFETTDSDESQSETVAVTDTTAIRQQRQVGENVNHAQWTTSTYNTTTWNGSLSRPEIIGYDLSTPGTIVSLRDAGDATAFGFTIETTAPVDIVVESVPETAGPFRLDGFQNTTTITSGFEAPETTGIRIRNATTAGGTADAILNDDN